MAGSGLFRVFDPKVRRHLIADEGEIVIDEVRHHWVVFLLPMLETLIAVALLIGMLWMPITGAGVLLIVVLVLLTHAFWRFLTEHRDRFVITNMRVMRIRGVFSQRVATTPIMRILDITLDKPMVGRVFGYGHFIFESAAQDQGFREIKYVSRPDDRDLTIQRVIQRTGLRAQASVDVQKKGDSDDDGTGPQGMDSERSESVEVVPSRPVNKVIFNSENADWTSPFDQ
jgi:uncharacterized membrane protein YdbT with pleckstrin-like domain